MTYSTDFRQLALQKIEQGLSVRQAAQEMGIVRATLRGWIKNPIPKGYPKQRKCRKISREALLQDVAEYPDAYHDERAQRFEPPRVSRRPNFLREYPNEKYLLT